MIRGILPQDGVPETATAEFEALVTRRPNISDVHYFHDPDRAAAEMSPNHLPRVMFWAVSWRAAAACPAQFRKFEAAAKAGRKDDVARGRTAVVKLNQIREAHDRP